MKKFLNGLLAFAVVAALGVMNPGSNPAYAAGSKISELPAGAPLVGTDTVPMQRGAGNVKGTLTNIADFVLGTLDTDDVSEATNQYYTAERVDDRVNALIIAGGGLEKSYDDSGNALTISGENYFKTANNNCSVDNTKELEAFLVAHSGIAIIRPGDCLNLAYLTNSTASSSSSVAVGTGAKTFTVAANSPFFAGQPIRAMNNTATYMDGTVTSYSGTTLVINAVTSTGSGTPTSWTISSLYTSNYDLTLVCAIAGTCTLNQYDITKGAIHYWVPDNVAFDSKTTVSSISTALVNKDDNLPKLVVADASGYSKGDYVKLVDSTPVGAQYDSGRAITAFTDNGSTCIVTTSGSHGYSSTHRIFINHINATGAIGDLDGTEASPQVGSWTGFGRLYNITVLSSTTFSLQALDNSTDTQSGTDVRCATGTYTGSAEVHRQVSWAAESARVQAVDYANNAIYLEAKLGYPNNYVQSPFLVRYTKARKFLLQGFKVISDADLDDATDANNDIAIDIGGVPEAKTLDIECNRLPDACIMRRGVPGAIARNIISYRLPNRATYTSSNASRIVTGITVASQAVFTYYNENGTGTAVSNSSEIGLSSMPTGWTSLEGKIWRVADASGSGCTDSGHTCTFKLKDTFGNYANSAAFTPAFSGTAASGDVSDVTGLGYTLADNGSNYGATGTNIESHEGRHTTTTGASQLGWTASLTATGSLWRFGPPTYVVYTDIRAYGSYGVPMDKHEEGTYISWYDVHVEYPARGPEFGSYEGAGGQIRGGEVYVNGYYQIGGKQGIRVEGTVNDANVTMAFHNITMKDLVPNGTTLKTTCSSSETNYDIGFRLCSQVNNTFVPRVVGTNWNFQNVSVPISAFENSKVAVDGMNVRDYYMISDNFGGSDVRLRQLTASLVTNTHTAAYNIIGNMRSSLTYGGSSMTIQGFKNTKGTDANYPKNMFEEFDANATKTVYVSGFEETNDSAVAQTNLFEPSSTTLSFKSTIKALYTPHEKCIALSDQSTTITAGTSVGTLYLPAAAILTGARIYAATAPTGTMTVDLNEGSTTVMASTKLTLDANEFTGGTAGMQGTAAAAAVISDSNIAAGAALVFDVDSTTGGKGLVGCVTALY